MRHDNVVLDKSVSRRRPTLRDVGHLAHVDPSIASRVLGGEMNRVSEREIVRDLSEPLIRDRSASNEGAN